MPAASDQATIIGLGGCGFVDMEGLGVKLRRECQDFVLSKFVLAELEYLSGLKVVNV
jgi:hypothetical protein